MDQSVAGEDLTNDRISIALWHTQQFGEQIGARGHS
jgi:hypothetical protein